MYGIHNIIAFQSAADLASERLRDGANPLDVRAAAEDLLPHVFRAIEHLLGEVGLPGTTEVRARLTALMRLGHSQASISKASGVSPGTISRILAGSTVRPSTKIAERLLSVPVEAPSESPVDAELLAKLGRGEQVPVPFGQKDRYAKLLAAAGADTRHIVHTMRMSYARAIKAQKAAA